jgi:preprotein translocase subunit YajC
MFTHLLALLADNPPAQQQDQGNPLSFMPLLVIGVILFYLLILRPMRNQEKERQNLLAQMNKGDKVITISAIYGTIVSVSDKPEVDEIVVKVDDNVRLKMTKNAIHRNLTNEEKAKEAKEAAAKAKAEAKAAKDATKAAAKAGKDAAKAAAVTATPPAQPPSTSVTTKEGKA